MGSIIGSLAKHLGKRGRWDEGGGGGRRQLDVDRGSRDNWKKLGFAGKRFRNREYERAIGA